MPRVKSNPKGGPTIWSIAANFYAESVLFTGPTNGVEQAIFREGGRALLVSFTPYAEGAPMSFNAGVMVFLNLRIFAINIVRFWINF